MQLPAITNKPYFAELKSKKPVSLAKIAKSSGVNIKTLNTLNPGYKNGIVSKEGAYSVLIPVSKIPVVKAQLPYSVISS